MVGPSVTSELRHLSHRERLPPLGVGDAEVGAVLAERRDDTPGGDPWGGVIREGPLREALVRLGPRQRARR
jgi:hypothetical protein